jgi:TatA/E family protein of Tat protein translocase
MLGNIGLPEMLMILAVVLLVFGAKRLPEIGASFEGDS